MSPARPIEQYLRQRASEVNAWLDRLTPPETTAPMTIHRAMRYSLLGGGKRIRPILTLAAGEALQASTGDLMPTACALEMIHTYSLIHDDLPAMDDDDFRRGRKTCHKVFGDAAAILAGDALLTRAFQVIAAGAPADHVRKVRVITVIAEAAGTVDALIGGQMADLEGQGKSIGGDALEYIHRSKTGALICAAVVSGGVVAGAGEDAIAILRAYGERVGLAFQIADDLLDRTSTREELGKTPGKDAAASKATFPAVHGVAESEARARQLVDEANEIVSGLGVDAAILQDLAEFIIARNR